MLGVTFQARQKPAMSPGMPLQQRRGHPTKREGALVRGYQRGRQRNGTFNMLDLNGRDHVARPPPHTINPPRPPTNKPTATAWRTGSTFVVGQRFAREQ